MNNDSALYKLSFWEKYGSMIRYIAKRILLIIPVLFIISLIIFSMIEFMPGDPLNAFLNPELLTGTIEEVAEKRAYWTEELGLNDPFPVRFVRWWGQLLKGDFGYSVVKYQPVKNFVGNHIYNSFVLNVFAFMLAFAIAIVVGIKSAVKKYSLFDNFFSVFSIVGISLPSFFMAMLLIFGFAVSLKILPFNGMLDPLGIRPTWSYYVLPVTVITLGSLASLIKYVRNAMLEVLKQDYIRTARAKGLAEKVVIYRHAFRNALIPVITLVGFWIPGLFGGSIIIEKIFVWPGIGLLMNQAYAQKDRSVLVIVLVFYALLTLLGNLFMDVGYSLADPRVREGGSK